VKKIRFAGYAAIFNRIDKGGDIIRPGAFGSLTEGQELPLLWQHNPDQQIGSVTYAQEDWRGLRVIGAIKSETRAGGKAIKLLGNGSVKGLSFGYSIKQSKGQKPRMLFDLDVAEVSLVTIPMQKFAFVHAFQFSA